MHRNALVAEHSRWGRSSGGVAMQLPLHYCKCTTAEEFCYFSYTKSAAYNKRQLTLDRTKLKIPMMLDPMRGGLSNRQAVGQTVGGIGRMSGLVHNTPASRLGPGQKGLGQQTGSSKFGLQIIVKYDAGLLLFRKSCEWPVLCLFVPFHDFHVTPKVNKSLVFTLAKHQKGSTNFMLRFVCQLVNCFVSLLFSSGWCCCFG